MNLKQVEKELYHTGQVLTKAKLDYKIAKVDLEEMEHKAQVVSLATKILEHYLESVSSSVSDTLESLMRSALQVFNLDIDVTLTYKEGSMGGYRLQVTQCGVTGGIESFGGGVMSLISFIMLIATIVLKEKRRFLVLDENLKEVSEIYQEPLSAFMKQLCSDFGFTILLISHQPTLNTHATTIYEVTKGSKGTKIKEQL